MRWVRLFVGLGVLSCGGAQAEAPAPVVVTSASGTANGAELADVPPAVGKGFWLRVASPARDLPILAQLLPLEENVLVLLGNPERSLVILGSDRLAGAADLSRPLDVMAGAGPENERKFVVAFSARPDARERLSLRRVARGRHAVEDATGRLFAACELWELPPPTGGRILCGGSGAALRDLGPDLIHNTTRRTNCAFRVELAGAAYRSLLDKTVAEQSAANAALSPTERSGADLGRKWTVTVLGGEHIGFDITLADRSIELAIDIRFGSVEEPMFASFLAAASAASAPPAAYAALPADSQMRGALAGLDAATGRALRDAGLEAMLVALEQEMEVTPAQRDEVERAFAGVVPERLRGVFAVGRDLEAASRLLAVPDQPGLPSKELERAMEGWTVIGVEAEPVAYLSAVREFVKVANYGFPDKPSVSPQNRRQNSKLKQRAAPKGLPAGSMHLVDEVRPNPAYKPGGPDALPPLRAYDRHIFVVPDAPTVWFVAALREADALARAKRLLVKPAAKAEPMAADRAVLLGELSLAGAVAQSIDIETRSQRDEARVTLRRLAELPARGNTGIPLSLRVVEQPSNSGKGYELRIVGELSPEVVTDWLRFAVTAAKTRAFGKP